MVITARPQNPAGNNDPARHALWEMRAETDGQECSAGLIDQSPKLVIGGLKSIRTP